MAEGDPQDWKETLPEDIRAHPSLESYKMPEDGGMISVPPDLIKSYVGQQKLIGRDKIPLPPEDATDEDWNEVWSRLGRPEKADGYELKIAEDLPDIVKNEMDEELMTGFSEICHKAGIIPKQAQMVLDWFLPANAAKKEKSDQAGEEFSKKAEAELRKEWGKAYDEKVKSSSSTFFYFADQMGAEKSEQLKTMMDKTGMGDDPLLVGFFAKIGELIGEDVITGKARSSFALTPDQAGAEIDKIYGDEKHPYHHPKHAEHKMAVERMNQLTEMQIAAEEGK